MDANKKEALCSRKDQTILDSILALTLKDPLMLVSCLNLLNVGSPFIKCRLTEMGFLKLAPNRH